MMPPAKPRVILNTIWALAAYLGIFLGHPAQALAVEHAMHVHWEAAELTSLARAIGQELSEEPISGSSSLTLSGQNGGERFIAKGLNFSVAIADTDAKFNGSTGILSKINLTDLVISFDQIQFLGSPGKTCRNISISSGSNLVPMKLELKPFLLDGRLELNTARVAFQPNPDIFKVTSLGSCKTAPDAAQLAKKLGLLSSNVLKHPIVESLTAKTTDTITAHFSEINQSLNGAFSLPSLQTGDQQISANVQLIPEAVIVGPSSIDIILGADFSFAGANNPNNQQGRQSAAQGLAFLNKQARSSSWIGFTNQFLSGAVSAANDFGMFSPTLNAETVPTLIDLLKADSLQALAPDARKRFAGSEPVSIRFGKAPKISVIYQPNGPGGIPIINMLLTDIDVDIDVAGKHYMSTTNSMQFRFTAEMDQVSNKISLKFVDAKSKVSTYSFAKDLVPRPRDRSFDRSGFTNYLKSFVGKSCKIPGANSGFMLPTIEIGSYYFSWQRVRLVDQMLILDTSIEPE